MQYWSKQEYRENVSIGNNVIKYGTEWCAPCRKLESFIKSVESKYPNLNFVSVDGDEIPTEVTSAGVFEYPTMRLCINGVECGRFEGMASENTLNDLFTAWNCLAKMEK